MADLTSDSDATCDLLARIRQNDEEALGTLLRKFRPGLHAYVQRRLSRRLGARVDASDVVQEVQLNVAQRIQDFLKRQPMPFHLWLRKTAYERLTDLRRHHHRKRRSVLAEAVLPNQTSQALCRSLVDRQASPSAGLDAKELAQEISRAVAELSETDQEILLLRQVEKTPFAEIAAMLEIDPAAARKRFGRALLKLQKRIDEKLA